MISKPISGDHLNAIQIEVKLRHTKANFDFLTSDLNRPDAKTQVKSDIGFFINLSADL